jgi:Flp pilus assembly protein TadD
MRILSASRLCLLAPLLLGACATRGGTEADADSRMRVAAVAEQAGQMDVALSLYRAAAEREPNRTEVQLRYAKALRRQGRIAQADGALSAALERHPAEPTLLQERGRVELQSGMARKALATFEQVLKDRPRAVGALNGRGVALDMLGRHAEARQSYTSALDINPDDTAAANNKAVSLLLDGQPAAAEMALERLNQGAVPPRIRHNLGLARAAAGDLAGARQAFGNDADEQTLQQYMASMTANPLGQPR